MSFEFWKKWRNLSKIEEKAIEKIKEVNKDLTDKNLSERVVAVYLAGSFVRREMNEKSDIDVYVIVKKNEDIAKILSLNKKYREIKPKISICAYSLWELENGKGYPLKMRGLSLHPARFVKFLDYYECIAGNALNSDKLKRRTDKEDMELTIKSFDILFFPLYAEKKFGFQDIVKQVFWTTNLEQRLHGKEPPHSWRLLAKSIKDKDHIVHQALKYRLHQTKDKKKIKDFITQLKEYLRIMKEDTLP